MQNFLSLERNHHIQNDVYHCSEIIKCENVTFFINYANKNGMRA